MTITSKVLYFIISAIFFIIFDMSLSELILDELRFKIQPNPIFDLMFIQNTGAAFSILENYKLFLIAFSFFAIAVILNFLLKNAEKF